MNEVLIVSIGFSPNVGGIETHFDDLVAALSKRNWKVYVLTNVKALSFEKRGKNISIFRIPWFGSFFYKLVNKPFLEFLYLTPGLFIALPIFLILKGRNIKVIHSHGLVAGLPSVFWGKIFGKRVITTTHSIYNFPQIGFYRNFAKWIFGTSDLVLTLSKQSKKEIEDLEIPKEKVKVFTYWVDLNLFKKIENAKKRLNLEDGFVVFCASRLVPEKGIGELLKAASMWNKKIYLIVSSVGPLKYLVERYARRYRNISYVGGITQDKVALYLSANDLLIVPSIHEEGFGRVILESLACGTPVLGSNRGAIPEAMDNTVGKLIDITPENIKNAVEYFYKNPAKLDTLSKNCRNFALKRYSEKNVQSIIEGYTK
jgi:glycosyltransferase involved in cell wall biosynthesis